MVKKIDWLLEEEGAFGRGTLEAFPHGSTMPTLGVGAATMINVLVTDEGAMADGLASM